MLRHFYGTFDFVHGLDPGGAISGGDVDRRGTTASPLVVGIQRRVPRMQRYSAGTEPVRDFTECLLAVGVVEVLARAKDFNGLGPAADQLIEQARMQPLLDENVSRNRSQHISLWGVHPKYLKIFGRLRLA